MSETARTFAGTLGHGDERAFPRGHFWDHDLVTSNSERRLDLVSEMHASVWEGVPLHEVTSGVTDILGEGRSVVHGPWTEAECQSVLIPWQAAGWIDLVADVDPPWSLATANWYADAVRDGAFLVLSAKDAADLLRDPARWIVGTADGHVMLSRTAEGDRHDYAEWIALTDRA